MTTGMGIKSKATKVSGVLLLVTAALLFSPGSYGQSEDLSIGVVGGLIDEDTAETFIPLSDYLSDLVPPYRFKVNSYESIEKLTEAVDQGQLEFALITPAAYIEISSRLNIRPLATVTQKINDNVVPWLAGAAFVRADRNDLSTLEDAKDKRVIALSPLAMGGWLSVVREWDALGINVTRDIGSIAFESSYEQIVNEVCVGNRDIGVISAASFARVRDTCADELRVLENPLLAGERGIPAEVSTRLYPGVPFVLVKETIDEELITRTSIALLSLEPESDAAKSILVSGFTIPMSYDPVIGLMQELQLGPYENYGQFTIGEFVRQHLATVMTVLLGFLGILSLAFIHSKILYKRLAESEQFRTLLFDKSNFPVVVFYKDTLNILDLNPSAVEIYGFRDRTELLGKGPLEVSAPAQPDGSTSAELIQRIQNNLSPTQPFVFEWEHRRPDGTIWEAEIHLLPFTYSGHEMLQATLVDVTERNRIREERARMEQQLRHSQRLESLGRLSGAIAHDFNNLLTVINGYSEVLLMGMEKTAAEYRTVMEISQACWRACELTNQLLTFSRRQISNMKPLDVNALILDAVNMFRSLLGETIELNTSLNTDIGFTLADSGLLNQVLMNMLVNAKDAMPEGGRCSITTDRKRVGESDAPTLGIPEGDYVVINVVDTGGGMDAESKEHIFEPFFSTKGEKGTGIGLATAYGIIRQCGGTITFLSELGEGTTFTIYLPVTDRHPSEAEDKEISAMDLKADRALTVLVVEDQPDVRAYASSVLESSGYRVLESESGNSALELIKREKGQIDMLFADVVMPGLNGRELADIAAEAWPDIRILLTSGYANDEVALLSVVQERMQFISKPYTPKGLLEKVKSLLA